jgi:predicted NBD/HSP70 family sugar kinase
MIGVELLGNGVIVVGLDDAGRILERVQAGASDDPVRAVADALTKLAAAPTRPIAVAAVDPDRPDFTAAVDALRARYPRLAAGPLPASGTAAAAAEAWTGAARGATDVVYFGVEEHASAGILRQGTPVVGAHRRAPAVAWLALNPVEREDYRKIGCLEAEVAAVGIVRRLIWRIKAGDRSRVQEAVHGDLAAITVDHVLAAARGGDGVSISVMRDTAKYLGMAAANLVAVADPDVLVLGGIMASAGDLLLEAVRSEIARRLPPPMVESLTIVPAALGGDAPAVGAVRLAAAAVP